MKNVNFNIELQPQDIDIESSGERAKRLKSEDQPEVNCLHAEVEVEDERRRENRGQRAEGSTRAAVPSKRAALEGAWACFLKPQTPGRE